MEGKPEELKNSPVSAIMEEPFPTISVNTPAVAIIDLLQSCQAVLTVKNGKVEGIITNTDIGKIFSYLK
jgi:predicted transcriptional regulator